jgi:hypothetical protein
MAVRRKAIVGVVVAVAVLSVVGIRAVMIRPDDWMPTLTDDPALIAQGEALFETLPQVADSRRDPYATACGMPAVSYCASSPTLTPHTLIAATGAQLVAHGARLEHRVCPEPDPDSLFNMCGEAYSYRGVQVSIMANDYAESPEQVPTFVFGRVLTSTQPPEAPPTPLGSWPALKVAPAEWGEPPCVAHENGGCVHYEGRLGGTSTVEDARRSLRTRLQEAGFRIDLDRCTTNATGATRCHIGGHRFRALGGHEGVRVLAGLSSVSPTAGGFSGLFSAIDDNAKWTDPSPAPTMPADPS